MTLLFEKGVDQNAATVETQRRITLSGPGLPDAIRRQGIAVRKRGVCLVAVVRLANHDDSGKVTPIATFTRPANFSQFRILSRKCDGFADGSGWAVCRGSHDSG